MGTRSTPWVVKNGLKNDDLSSIKVPQGYSATIYEHWKYGGKKKTFGPGNFACLTQYKMNSKSWNDQISSIKIAKTKRRCGPTTRQFCPCGRAMKNGCATSHCKKCKRIVRCPVGRPFCRGRKTVKHTYMYHGKKCVKYSCGGRRMDGGRGRYMERKRKARKKATEKRCASKWHCGVSGLSTPVAIDARTGDVQCMSSNGKDCWWGRCLGRKVPRVPLRAPLRPLVCGAHHKKMWGGTGYNNKHHWCNKVKKPVAKMCKQRKLIHRPKPRVRDGGRGRYLEKKRKAAKKKETKKKATGGNYGGNYGGTMYAGGRERHLKRVKAA